MIDCQQRNGRHWVEYAANDGPSKDDLRCPECHGRVFFFKGVPAHFEHQRPAHLGCSRVSAGFNGRSTPHPDRLV